MPYVKLRRRPARGSIPDLLEMSEREVRFYREIGPHVGVRVPNLVRSQVAGHEVRLELEDLSSWHEGADPAAAALKLKELHARWEGIADDRWPWLNRAGRGAAEVGALYDRVWSDVRERGDISATVRRLGDSLSGRVAELEREESAARPRTLIHGDASVRNMRTSPTGVVALLDWEDVRSARGEVDLTWLLVSSVDPHAWADVIAAYEPDSDALHASLPANAAQAILGLSDHGEGTVDAIGWIERLEAARSLLS